MGHVFRNGARNVAVEAHGAHENLKKSRQIIVGNSKSNQNKFLPDLSDEHEPF